jgi:preprotein translocase subunit SecD
MLNLSKWKITAVAIICLLGFYQFIPNFLPTDIKEKLSNFLPSKTLNLGLDLRGGSHLLLQVDFDIYVKESLSNTVDEVRKNFRKENIRYKDLSPKISNGDYGIKLNLIDVADFEAAKKALKEISPEFSYDLNGNDFTASYNPDALKKIKRGVLEKSIEIVRRRVDETGTREPTIQMQGDDRILLQVPGLENPEMLKSLLGKTAKMNFHLMDEDSPYATPDVAVKVGTMLLDDIDVNNKQKYLVKKAVALGGDQLVDAAASYDNSGPVVSFRFNNVGGKKFAQITTENIGKPFAVVLDGKVITAPRINGAITGGSGIITGNFTVAEATELALLLRSGALPAPIKIIEERSVGPSLGSDSINSGTKAAVIGLVLVAIMMLVIYGLFGAFSVFALCINIILLIAALSLLQATLTLPGIAGIILTMGMAVDANVLIYERIRDEIALGKTPLAAVDSGFSQAFRTILDSNLTTLIATLLLYIFGTGPVKGFAVTLSLGIICSMFTAITITRMLVVSWMRRTKPKKLPL